MRAFILGLLLACGLVGTAPAQTQTPASVNGCIYYSSLPTLVNGQRNSFLCDVNGKLLTSGGGGVPTSIAIPTTTTGCATANGVFFNSSNTLACASGFTTTGTEAAIASGTQTTSLPILALTQTWNNAGTTFTAVDINVTNTASNAASLIQNWRLGGVTQMSINRAGVLAVLNSVNSIALTASSLMTISGTGLFQFSARSRVTSPADGYLRLTDSSAAAPSSLQLGSSTITNEKGALFLDTITAAGTAPGAGAVKVIAVCGTLAGTAKLVAYAGTSNIGTTILDNIGGGVTGC